MEHKIKAIDVLRTLLGTMVLKPEFKTDPNDITSKVLISNNQHPIVEGVERKVVLDKMIDLVKSL